MRIISRFIAVEHFVHMGNSISSRFAHFYHFSASYEWLSLFGSRTLSKYTFGYLVVRLNVIQSPSLPSSFFFFFASVAQTLIAVSLALRVCNELWCNRKQRTTFIFCFAIPLFLFTDYWRMISLFFLVLFRRNGFEMAFKCMFRR